MLLDGSDLPEFLYVGSSPCPSRELILCSRLPLQEGRSRFAMRWLNSGRRGPFPAHVFLLRDRNMHEAFILGRLVMFANQCPVRASPAVVEATDPFPLRYDLCE